MGQWDPVSRAAARHVRVQERGRLAARGFTVHTIADARHTLVYGWHDVLLAALLS